MFYTYCEKSGAGDHSPIRDLSDAELPGIVAALADQQKVLHVWRDDRDHLELAATSPGINVTEVYGSKRFHLRGYIANESAMALIRAYRKESVATAADWYPSLIEWRGLRFSKPRLFALLNERYKVTNIYVMGAAVAFGVVIFIVCFGLGMLFDLHSKLIFSPLIIYAIILAKRVEFSDPAQKRYGYGG